MINFFIIAYNCKENEDKIFVFLWYFIQHFIRRIQLQYMIKYCIFCIYNIVRKIFKWSACGTKNSISGHLHLYNGEFILVIYFIGIV